ncbi:hypothetical protein PIB30_028615 [Stylosanthes scabra]|uniref:Reverse transcriptase zinc-binding domain-containing protein n=1 Tax=Stylosanthes scabra TaxID=79078 RepID=A0ABU6Y9Y4_9FABA|nr:hypothetical protein [Stylosanthes scabra]
MKSKNGVYSVALGYSVAFQFYHPPLEFLPEHCREKSLWSSIWGLKNQPRIKNFIWKVAHNGLPVKAKLHDIIQTINPICPRSLFQLRRLRHGLGGYSFIAHFVRGETRMKLSFLQQTFYGSSGRRGMSSFLKAVVNLPLRLWPLPVPSFPDSPFAI